MNSIQFDPGATLAAVAALVALAAAAAIARARSLLAIALMLAVFAAALAAAFVGLAAPDLGLVTALAGAGVLPLAWIGAVLLTAPSLRTQARTIRLGAVVGAIAVAAGLAWTLPDLPPFGQANASMGRVYVSRAVSETGVRNGVAAVAGNYRVLDSLAQIAALMAAAFGAHAMLGFGERAARGRPERDGES